jgi:hypothetical protein
MSRERSHLGQTRRESTYLAPRTERSSSALSKDLARWRRSLARGRRPLLPVQAIAHLDPYLRCEVLPHHVRGGRSDWYWRTSS